MMDADGQDVVRLTEHPGLDYAVEWSPDGRRLAFVRVDEGRYGIWVMDRDGSDARLVIDGCHDDPATSGHPELEQLMADFVR